MIRRVLYYSTHASELGYIFQMKKEFDKFKPSQNSLTEIECKDDISFCYEALKKVSRSFSVVIQQLPTELKNPVCLFYLILRGLDTIEDDMSISPEIKREMLLSFADRINKEEFILNNVGDKQDYRDLMLHFDRVIREYQHLDEAYKNVITKITHEMAIGMDKYSYKVVESYQDWNDYCYYVAGVVGIGLSGLFLASKLENDPNLHSRALSIEMGLFLQKTNIIRDFSEDLEMRRIFWPEESWKGKVKDLYDLKLGEKEDLNVLNSVVINALEHIPSCLKYLKSIEHEQIFRFCAIPQLMAIATLVELYNNPRVFHENIKIRKGKTARYFMTIENYQETKSEFVKFLQQLSKKDESGKISVILKKVNDGKEL